MTPLHIPLTLLPAPVPMWTPGVFRVPDGATYFQVAICYPTEDGDMWVMEANRLGRPPIRLDIPASDVLVDLTPPPLYPDGNPTRVDALPVLVGMLARAMGHPEGQATLTLSVEAWGPCWTLLTAWFDGRERQATHMFFAGPSGCGGWKMNGISAPTNVCGPLPALASIDLADPNATRLALAALFAARVWETA